jgi:exodeoxyribonuclease-3
MSLKLLSYNIWDGGNERLPLIGEIIRAHQPEVVALIEVTDWDAIEQLARDLGMSLVAGESNTSHHVAWLSRLPIQRAENHRSRSLAKTLLELEVRVGEASICLFASHLGSRWDAPQPVDEIPVILEVLRQRADRPHLLVGDLNGLAPDDPVGSPPRGVAKRGEAIAGASRPAIRQLLAAGYVDAYRILHPEGPGYTYPADAPWLRLDYVFLGPRLAVRLVACDVVDDSETRRASDHLPIWAELS